MKIIKIFERHGRICPGTGPALNIRQLLNPIFFERACRHVDMKRQRLRRLRSKALAQARWLKYESSTWVPDLPQKQVLLPFRYAVVPFIEALRACKDATWWEL